MAVHLEDVRPAIVVVVNEATTPFHVLGVHFNAGCVCHFRKGPVAIVVVEVRRVVGEVRLENIEPAIAIKISHGHAHPGLLVTVFAISTAGHDGDVCKRPIVIVVKENAGLGI